MSWQSYGRYLVGNYFSPAAYKILSFSLTFVILTVMCLHVGLFPFIYFGTLHFLNFCVFYFFARLRKFSAIISSVRFLIPCSLSSPSGTPMMQILLHFYCLKDPLNCSHYLNFIFLFAALFGCFLLPCLPNFWFDLLLHPTPCVLLLVYSSFQILCPSLLFLCFCNLFRCMLPLYWSPH